MFLAFNYNLLHTATNISFIDVQKKAVLLAGRSGKGGGGSDTTQLTFAQKVPLLFIGFNRLSDLYNKKSQYRI